MTDETLTPDDSWLDELKAQRGGFDQELMAGVGDDMLAEAMKQVQQAEEVRLLRELTDVASDWAFPPWSESYNPEIDDRKGAE